MNSLVTPSQVTSLIFNPHSREILSSHGLPDNQLSIWSFPTLTKIIDIPSAHETRILHSCISPDGTTVATASSDENLKFWKVFEVPKKSAGGTGGGFVGAGKGNTVDGKGEGDIGRRGRTGINLR
jgi:cell division cycle protein 20 (cofactor of APC complex)